MNTLTFGRGPGVDIRVDNEYVDRRHCRVHQLDSDRFMVEDLGSTNGTYLRRRWSSIRVTTSVEMIPGDMIHLGGPRGVTLPWHA